MRLMIRQLLLWPKDNRHSIRVLDFALDKVNLVTGLSRTGKSAISYIVDYVLGSGKCAIPVGEIRRCVSWYGLVLDIGGTQLLVAREEPGDRIASDNYYVDERQVVAVPPVPKKNTNRDSFKNRMNLLAGLPNLDFDADGGGGGYSARPSFRDMAAFNFLPQHIVANPYTLFFKADTNDHRQKLRTIFPFVLGAMGVEHLVAEHELADLERRLRRLTGQLNQRERAAEAWKAEAFGLHGRAIELGLLPNDSPRPTSLPLCIQALAAIPSLVSTDRQLPARAPGSTLAAAERLEGVRQQERDVDRRLGEARIRLERVRGLRQAVEDFSGVASDQSGRVQGVGWLQKKLASRAPCPVCGSEHDGARSQLDQLAAAAADLAARQRTAKEAPVALQREEQDLIVDVREREEALRALRTERRVLESERSRNGGQALEEVYRFVGRVEEALRNLSQTEDGSELREQIAALGARIKELQATLDEKARQRSLAAAHQLFSRSASHYAQFLGLERCNDAVGLRLSDLTLVFTSQGGGREDFLWEIGSGANWMGYHIATLLSLHEMFLGLKNSPVPTFLLIDQPSQVYFPAGWPEAGDGTAKKPTPHDIQATRRIFETLSEGLRRMKYQVQVIVTEHADSRTLGELLSLHTVADWHEDEHDGLIPKAWLS